MKQILFILVSTFFINATQAQSYKSFKLANNGDTLNIVDKNDKKQGKWVIHVDPLRGEKGYEEEGVFIDGKKEGPWRRYTLSGDFIAMENYRDGGLDGKSAYFSAYGELLREESWRAYDPKQPYDTIAIYGEDNNQILNYKIVKAEPYSVKDGVWTYYDPSRGTIIRTEKYERGHLIPTQKSIVMDAPMEKIKPKEVLEYEKKNSGKKKVKTRDGSTGL